MRRIVLLPVFLLALSTLLGPAGPLPAQEPEPPEPEGAVDKLTPVLDVGGHTAALARVRFTPDGKQLVTGSQDGTLRVWDVATGLPLRVLRVPGLGGGSRFALSPDGKLVAVAASYTAEGKTDRLVYLMDLADGTILRTLTGPTQPVLAVAFAPDGKRLAAVAGDKVARVYDVATGKQEVALPLPRQFLLRVDAEGVAFSPDGTRIACAAGVYNTGLAIFDLESRKEVGQVAGTRARAIRDVAWLAADTLITYGQDGPRLWSADGMPRPDTFDFGRRGTAFAVGADVLLFAWNDTIYHRVSVLDRSSGKELRVFVPQKSEGAFPPTGVQDVAIAPDGKLAASCGGRDGIHETFLWDVATGKTVRRLAAPRWLNPAQSVFWRGDGRAVGWTGPKMVKGPPTFDLADLAFIDPAGEKDRVGAVHTLDGRTLKQLNYNSVNIQKDGEPDVKLPRTAHTIQARTFAGPDRVALAEDYGGFLLADAKTGKKLHTFDGRHGYAWSIAPHPDKGRYLVSLSLDQVLRVWDTEKDRALLNLYVRGDDWVVWTEEGYYAATPGGERFLGWSQDNGKDAAPTYHPAERFRSQLYRPDVIKLVLKEGSVAKALQTANAVRKESNVPIPQGEGQLDRLLPPVATLTMVGQVGAKVTLRLEARAGCPEQPIKSMRLLLDGHPFPGGVGRFAYPDGKFPPAATEEVTIDLPPGRHRLSVLTRAKDDAPSASNAVEVVSPVPVTERPVVRHVAVGVARYANKALDLKTAADDAKALGDAFAASAARGQIYRTEPPAVLLDEAATSKAVLAALAAVRAKARAGDLFVFSFAGHGVRDEGEFYLLTHEADMARLAGTAVSGAALRESLADFPCQVLLLLDTCQSGAFVPGKLGGYQPATDEAARALAAVETRAAVLCAAQGHEEAFEAPGGGLFTRAVVKALNRGPGVFYDPETGELNVLHLGAYVYQEVTRDAARMNRTQTPYLKLPLAQPAFVVAQFPK